MAEGSPTAMRSFGEDLPTQSARARFGEQRKQIAEQAARGHRDVSGCAHDGRSV